MNLICIELLYFGIILIFSKLSFSELKVTKLTRHLKNKYSEIHLVIQGSGTQKIVSDYSYKDADDPSEVLVNGVKKDSCTTTCSLTGNRNNITLRFEIQPVKCYYMFYGLTNLIEVDLSNFDGSKVTTMNGMFNSCSNLEKVTIGNINTPLLEDFAVLFSGCSKLTSIDLSNFDTSQVTTMKELFKGCTNLEKIIFGNIITSSVKTMEGLFYGCSKLSSVDLSKFNTANVLTMTRMFISCTSLKYLDLSNFNTQQVTEVPQMFKDCSSLIFLNIKNFVLKGLSTNALKEVISGISTYVKYCIDDSSTQNSLTISSSKNDCSDTCFKANIRIDIVNNKCIEDLCLNIEYKYIYKDECYISCPDNTHELSCQDGETNCVNEDNKILCYDTNPEGYYLDTANNIYKKCYSSCKSCTGEGTLLNNNCKECIDNYIFLNENNYKTNCYQKCNDYYYFDGTNNFHCDTSCPNYYQKTIPDKKKCIDNCLKDDTYKYEYNNICYIKCPPNKYQLEDKSDNICYDQTPDGYYLDVSNGIYKKCYETCKKCDEGGNKSNHNCKECKTNYVFYINNNGISNCYQKCDNYYYFDESSDFVCTEGKQCPNNLNKLIIKKNKCIDDCRKDDTYKYEYNNMCYENEILETTIIQRKGTIDSIKADTKEEKEKLFYSTAINDQIQEQKQYYLTNIINQNNYDEININMIKEIFIFNNKSITNINIINNNSSSDISEQEIIEIQDQVLKSIQDIVNTGFSTENIDKGNDISISVDKVRYTITTTSNQKIEDNKIINNSKIDLGECENKLKDKYNISKNENLYILKVDVLINNLRKVEYDVYYPFNDNNFTKLNLTICKDTKVDISIPAIIPVNELDKYNKSSPLYNDICYTLTSESGTDKILKDRQKDFANNNLSVCEEDCVFSEYDPKIQKALCSCFTKIKLPLISEIKIDKDKMLSNFKNIKNIANVEMLKCYNLLYDKKMILKNSANFIVASLLMLSLISIFVFICHNIDSIKKKLNQFPKINQGKKNNNNNKNSSKYLNSNKIRINNNKNNKKNFINNNNNKKKAKNNQSNYKNNFKKNKSLFKNNNLFNLNLNNYRNNHINNNHFFNYKKKSNTNNALKLKLHKSKIEPKINKKKEAKQIQSNSKKILIKNKITNLNKNILNNNKIKFTKTQKNISYNDLELNSLTYKIAKIKDNRTYCQYYMSLLRTNHILIFTFFQAKDYNSRMIKIYIFFLTFAINYLISAMFYSDSTMHKIYEDKGSFDFTYQLPQMFYSLIISAFLQSLLNLLGLYEKSIISYRNNIKNNSIQKTLFKIKLKIGMFFIITYLLLFVLWVYLGCFCAIYKNTQIHLLKDVSSSFGLSFLTPFFICLVPGIFRIPALKKNTERPWMFKFSQLLQIL